MGFRYFWGVVNRCSLCEYWRVLSFFRVRRVWLFEGVGDLEEEWNKGVVFVLKVRFLVNMV